VKFSHRRDRLIASCFGCLAVMKSKGREKSVIVAWKPGLLSRPKSRSLKWCGVLVAILFLRSAYSQTSGVSNATATQAVRDSSIAAFVRIDDSVFALTHVTLFDGSGGPPKHDQMVVVDHGKITYSGPTISSSIPANAKVFVESGKTLLPGLIGMHEHLFYIAAGAGAGHLLLGAEQAESAPRLYLAAGITTARTTGSIEPVTDLAIKRAIEQGTQAGPDLDVTGPYLDGRPNSILQNQSLTGPDDARETVDYWSERGATSFKAYMDISPDELKAAIDEAHALKLKLTGHLCSVGFTEAINMGIDNLEHGLPADTEFDPRKAPGVCPPTDQKAAQSILALDIHGPELQGLIRNMIAHHVALTSTLAVYEDFEPDQPPLDSLQGTKTVLSAASWDTFLRLRTLIKEHPRYQSPDAMAQVLNKEMQFEREFVRRGGLLMAGSDPTGIGGLVAGFGDQREMELLVQAGFSQSEAVAIFTSNAAKYLGKDATIGKIAPGMQADLLLLDGDFEHDATVIRKPEIVFKNGTGWDSAKLQASVAGIAGSR
jgi:imidazolonepropionase-like amidohydrolase